MLWCNQDRINLHLLIHLAIPEEMRLVQLIQFIFTFKCSHTNYPEVQYKMFFESIFKKIYRYFFLSGSWESFLVPKYLKRWPCVWDPYSGLFNILECTSSGSWIYLKLLAVSSLSSTFLVLSFLLNHIGTFLSRVKVMLW